MPRRVSIFGATGSIGQSTLDLIRRAEPGTYKVIALSGGRNIDLLARDAVSVNAEVAVTAFAECLPELRKKLEGTPVRATAGRDALDQAAQMPADWIMSAIVGVAGLRPGLRALEQGSILALANKESLVSAGPLFMGHANKHGAKVIPVDSEHSAIFQALRGEDVSTVERVIITASGGAFRDWPIEDLAKATPVQAAKHPNWSMGQRITIDSASMFNKAMEIIETKEFFGIHPDQIETIIHPESMVHALVGFCDGALMAHVGPPDMRHAIGHALSYPDRTPLPVERLDLAALGRLRFWDPDPRRYPALDLARQVMEEGGLAGAVFTAAKEAALDAFIAGRVGFMDMAGLVEAALDHHVSSSDAKMSNQSLDSIEKADILARNHVDARASVLA